MHPVIWKVVLGNKFCHITSDKICGNFREITGHFLLTFEKVMPDLELIDSNSVHVNDPTLIEA